MKKRSLGILLALLLCVGLLTAGAAASSGGSSASGGAHTHFLCGGDDCTETLHSCEKVTFEPWEESGLPNREGNWYLTKDVTITSSWKPANGTVLCLNGYTITRTTTADNDPAVIHVNSDVTFSLSDCQDKGQVTNSDGSRGPVNGVRIEGTFNMYGGDITGIATGGTAGAGVEITDYSYGKFNMYGGSITKNEANSLGGGGVGVGSYGTFKMYGGVISGNYAYGSGGGVRSCGDVYMYGGEISGNDAYDDGGGVDIVTGTFTMEGGIITGNNAGGRAGGVDVQSAPNAMTVSGTAKIVRNVKNGTKNDVTGLYEGGISSDLYVAPTTGTLYLNIGTLEDGACIGITTLNSKMTTPSTGNIANCTNGDNLKRFFSNMDGYSLSVSGGNLIVEKTTYHIHPVCGAGCAHTDGSHSSNSVEWTGVSTYDELRTATSKYLYLKNDIALNGDRWTLNSDVVLCLNGKNLTAGTAAGAISVGKGKSFTLCDCQNKGEVTSTSTGNIVYVGGGYTYTPTTFTMYGGKLVGNSQSKNASVVYVESPDSGGQTIFNLYGGTISGNTSNNDGAGVRNNNGGIFNMYGGTITDNTVKAASSDTSARGAGVFNNGTFTMTGGTIIGNTASGSGNTGGGVYNNATIMNISGKVNITGNTGSNVYLAKTGSYTPPIFIVGALDKSAKIGVTTADTPGSSYLTIATDANNGYYDNITSDSGYYVTRYNNDVLLSIDPLHIHADSDGVEHIWTEFNAGSVAENGYYYLNPVGTFTTVSLSGVWQLNETKGVHLCLNGCTFGNSQNYYTITLTNGAELSIDDCQGGGKIARGYNSSGTSSTGSGILINSGSTLTLNSGTISGNSGSSGAGVWVAKGTFIMNGGEISNNTASSMGGGVCVAASSKFIMNGGEIKDNTGGGVDVENDTSTFTVSGLVNITANKNSKGEDLNVYLGSRNGDPATITIGGALNPDSRIGVAPSNTLNVIATGLNSANYGNFTDIFTCDWVGPYAIYQDAATKSTLRVGKHTHSWTFDVDSKGTTVTATCTASGEVPCPLNKNGGSITIAAPMLTVYGGNGSADATLTGSFDDAVGVTVSEDNIVYCNEDGKELEGAPTDAGEYTAKLTVGDKEIKVTYTIAQATLTESDFTFTPPTSSGLTYDGTAKLVDVGGPSDVSFTWKCYDKNGNEVEPINAGDYTVAVIVSGNANYADATLTSDNWKFTIAQREAEILWENSTDRVYGDGKKVTARVKNKVEGDEVSVVLEGGDAINAGEYTFKVTGLAGAQKDNYTLNRSILNTSYGYTIDKAPTKVVGAPKAATSLTYTGQAQELITTEGVSAKDGHGTVVYSLDGTNYDDAIPTGTDAGDYTVYYKVQGDTNYSDSAVRSVEVTIGKATITVTPTAGQSKVYGTGDPDELNFNFSDGQHGETASFDGKLGRTDGEDAGDYYITQGTLALKDMGSFKASNYELVVETGVTFEITKKELTIISAAVNSKTYDGNADAKVNSVTFDGLVGNESVEYDVVSAAFPDENADDANVNVTITVSLKGDVAKNYSLLNGTYVAASAAKINKKALTINGVTVEDKTYDGGLNATVSSSGTVTGAVTGDTVDYTVTGMFTDKNAGEGKTVNLTYELTAAAQVNYYIDVDNSQKTATAAIGQKEVHITGITIEDKTYDGTKTATVSDSGNVTGVVANDDLRYTVTGAFENKDAAKDKTVNLTYALEGADAGNYYIDTTNSEHQTTATATIKLKRILPESIIAAAKDYDGNANATVTVTFNTGVAGETLAQGVDYKVVGTFMKGGSPDPNAGENKFVSVQVELLNNDLAKNYTFGTSGDWRVTSEVYDWQATINKRDQPIVGQVPSIKATYGDKGVKVDYSFIDVQENAVVTFLTLDSTIVSVDAKTGELTFHKEGKTSIQITVWETANYNSVTKTIPIEVSKKGIRIAALDRTAYVGSAPDLSAPTLDTDYEIDKTKGLVEGDALNLDPSDPNSLQFKMWYEDENGDEVTDTSAMAVGTYTIRLELVGGTDDRYDITCEDGTLTLDAIPAYTVKVSDTEHGTVASNRRSAVRGQTVTLTVTPDEGYVLSALTVTDRSGKTITLTDKGDGKYTFKMPGSRVTVSASFRRLSVFTDIDDAWYTDDILWAEEMNIALDEDGSGLFRPMEDCTRAGIVTFLWRAAGCPEPAGTENPFTDVSESDPWYKAVLWAWETGVTKGYGVPNLFAPTATSTRAQTVLFLKRAAKADDVATGNSFTDVPEGAYYEAGVNWAVSEGLTNGSGTASTFDPNRNCSRAEIIAFIHRLLTK